MPRKLRGLTTERGQFPHVTVTVSDSKKKKARLLTEQFKSVQPPSDNSPPPPPPHPQDGTHRLEKYNDDKVFKKFRFHPYAILELTASVEDELAYVVLRQGSLTPCPAGASYLAVLCHGYIPGRCRIIDRGQSSNSELHNHESDWCFS